MDNIVFGRYCAHNTPIHKLDPRVKIFILILLTVGIFFQFENNLTSLMMSLIYLGFLIVLMIIAKVNFFDLFKSLSVMWLLAIFLMIVYIITPISNPQLGTAFTLWNLNVYWDSFVNIGYILLRLIILLSLAMVLTSSTRPMDMTYAFEWFMYPLKKIRFPVHEVAMTLSIALRFIPTLLDETNRIIKAQESRGADFKHGSLFKRFGAIISLIIPLFVSAIERSEELANAMEARGYDPKANRTRYKILKFSWRDLIALFIALCLFAGIVYLIVYDRNVEAIKFFK